MAQDPLVGRMLGNYQIIEKVGQGGMATVYVGYQESVDRRVAVKVLNAAPTMNEGFKERFQREARTIARLQHPHILPLYDYGDQEDMLYLVMAYVEGGSLSQRIDGPMSINRVERLLRELSGALDYAHRQGIIHRDIKPGNILLDTEGHALLSDFGIAKLVEGGGDLTGTGIIGTPSYMAPEQAHGIAIDGRADIYSLGVVVYHMLTGTLPFEATTPMQIMLKVVQDPPPDIRELRRDLTPALSAVMAQVMSKDPDDRYQTASAFSEAFQQAMQDDHDAVLTPPSTDEYESVTKQFKAPAPAASGTQPEVKPETQPSQTVVVQGVSPALLLIGFALIAVALVVAVLLISQDDDPPPVPPPTQVAQQPPPTVEAAAPALLETEAVEEPTPTDAPPPPLEFGSVTYNSVESFGDTVNLSVEGLRQPPADSEYIGWLLDSSEDSYLRIGQLNVNPLGSGSWEYIDPEGRVLPATYDALVITTESGEAGEAPSGEVVYQARVPRALTDALNEIFIASEEGFNGGSLLDGLRTEAEFALDHAGRAERAANLGGAKTHAEHTINILRGEQVDYDGAGGGQNPGRGVGVYFFIEAIEERLNAATAADGASLETQANVEFIKVCLENTRERADAVIDVEQSVIDAQDMSEIDESTASGEALMNELIEGVDLNQNDQIEAFEGECGLDQIETFGILAGGASIIEAEDEA